MLVQMQQQNKLCATTMPGDSPLPTSPLPVLAIPDGLLKLIKRLPSVLVQAFRLYFRPFLITVMLTGNYWFNLHAGFCS